ncbi:extracellular solute-binding protein [Paenarthrobacter sp.]|uniref:extracellular solute-binding protein n=1 Tax=Paenarthrobacter sp. TaxID=1931993 RepID=UPI002810BE72|nr:extracellular solute-binding protein [Paenarthrobacter sp.]
MKQFESLTGKSLSRRQLLTGSALLGGGLLTAGLTGCGGPAGAASRQTINFWHLLSGGDGTKMQAMIANANQVNAGFRVHPTVLAWGPPYYTKLAMASAGGRPPEVAIMHASRVPGYAPGGLIEPWDLGLLAENGIAPENFAPRIWEKGQQDGKVFSLALDSHPFIMFYNTDVAGKAGLLENNGRLQEVSSPEEFKAMALEMQKITKAHGLSFGYLNLGSQMWRLFYTLYKQHGAEIVLIPGKPMEADRDAAIESLEFMASLFDDTIAAKSGDINTGIAEFVRGDAGMLFSGGWELPTMKKANLPVDAVTIPTLYGTPASYADSHSFVLPRQLAVDEEKRKDTYKFVSDVLKGSLLWAEAGHIPAFQPVIQSPAYRELTPQVHYANAADIIAYDPEAWFSGSGSDWQTYFAEHIQNVLLGRDKAVTGWDGFVARTNDLLSRPNPV